MKKGLSHKVVALLTAYYAVILTFSLQSCLQKDLNASGCLKDCETLTAHCFEMANQCMLDCKESRPCEHGCLYQGEQCVVSALGCVSKCAKDLEEKLKQ